MLEVLVIVHVVDLVVHRVLPRFKVGSLVLKLVLFAVLAHCALLLLQEVFVVACKFHIAVFKCSLIGPPARIRRRYFVMKPGREVVHLQAEVAHTVHHLGLLRVRGLLPNHLVLSLGRLHLLQEDLRVPITRYQQQRLHLFLLLALSLDEHLAIQLAQFLVFGEPAASVEVYRALLVAIGLVHLHLLTDVDVGRANDQVVHGESRELDLVPLTEVREVDQAVELLGHVEVLAAELDVGLLVCLIEVVVLFAAAVASCDGRVVGDLLGEILEVIIDELVSLA